MLKKVFAVAALLVTGASPLEAASAGSPPFASHRAATHELWRISGHLKTKTGRRFDYLLTFFRFGLAPRDPAAVVSASRWSASEFFPAAASIVDETQARFLGARRSERGALGLAGASSKALDAHVDDWHLAGLPARNGAFIFSLRARIERETLAVRGRTRHSVVEVPLADQARSAGGCDANEVDLTSLDTTGTVESGATITPVTGVSWLDHAYGSRFLCSGEIGWDRFWVQLDDGNDILVEHVRQRGGSSVTTVAVLARPNGTHEALHEGSYVLTGAGGNAHWRSRGTHGRYPSVWELIVPALDLDVSLEPVLQDQENIAEGMGSSFWEGALDAYDLRPGTPGLRLGGAYAELTGYAEPSDL